MRLSQGASEEMSNLSQAVSADCDQQGDYADCDQQAKHDAINASYDSHCKEFGLQAEMLVMCMRPCTEWAKLVDALVQSFCNAHKVLRNCMRASLRNCAGCCCHALVIEAQACATC